jgi:hypothetical protein
VKAIKFLSAALIAGGLSGCNQMYWVKPDTNLQQTAKDLHECRMAVQPKGGSQVFSAVDLEQSCMGSKGYELSRTPPAK